MSLRNRRGRMTNRKRRTRNMRIRKKKDYGKDGECEYKGRK